jgi:nitroimidazol reductase NimA-like FMN-containing flavoprotein (pyridoxamine 5'-phosphate oxidase superfamily)/GNAT superfamily N-acetyltransferase
MRRPEFAMSADEARSFLQQAEVLHLALTRADGAPVLRTLNAAVTDEWLLFHGAPAGEKAQCIGRAAVVQAEETVCSVPSYFTDPERACPATTYFRSVQVHGTLERIVDPHVKADALQRMMVRYQPEGGHVPISFDTAMYQNAVRGVLVMGVRLENLTGKAKLGQNKKPHEITSVMDQLWKRGAPGDARAIALMFDHHPVAARPARFRGPDGTWLWPYLAPHDVPEALSLLNGAYWTRGVAPEVLARAQLGASVWVGAKDARGRLVATARANSDGARHAYVADVAVAPEWRGRSLGKALLRFLLEHPGVRGVGSVRLVTADAQGFYARFGFEPEAHVDVGYPTTSMLLRRPAAAQGGPQPGVAATSPNSMK